jgi:hypothetical protein
MPRLTKKHLVISLVALVAVSIGPVSAEAASTRGDYIGQVAPICQAYAPQLNQTATAYNRSFKLWLHLAGHGTLKAWVKQTRKTATALSAFNQVHGSLTEQIATVTPAPGDEAVVGTWLSDRRQAEAFATSAAVALGRIETGKFFKLIGQTNKAERAGMQVIAGFGLQTC